MRAILPRSLAMAVICGLLALARAASPSIPAQKPVVFWASDGLQPGDAVMLYGDGLEQIDTVRVWRLPDDASTPTPPPAPADAIDATSLQASGQCLKFLLPESLGQGVFAAAIPDGPTIVLNRPQVWFLQPVRLSPGLVENQAVPGSTVQVVGKDFMLPESVGTPACELLSPDGGVRHSLAVERAEKFSLRAALAAAEANGGGVVNIPWGTYRLTGWIRIPPRTTLRGEDRDATILKWPVEDPKADAEFAPAAVFGDASYAIENLSLVARSVTTILHDLGSSSGVPAELRGRISPQGSQDVFLRRVAFHHWMLCGHPERHPSLASKLTGNAAWNFSNPHGSIRNFEVSDCIFQGASQQFHNIRNARITGNSFSNGMGYCWTCLGGGAWFTVAERNDLRCSSSWGYGMIGLNRIYSAHNTSHNFVHGEREAMTLDISGLPATPAGPVPKGMHPIVGRNIAWFGSPHTVRPDGFRLEGIKAGKDEFVGKTAVILDGPGAGQFREITRNSTGESNEFSIDHPWDVPPTTASTLGLWDLCRFMIVYDCSAFDTSAFAQLYGSFYEYIVDGCTVDRSQGCWGQHGWFVQFRHNTIRYAHSYHHGIGMPGNNREGNVAFGYTGLTDGNLRITKFGSAQYGSPPNKPLFVRDVVPHPVPGVRGCVIRRNRLEFNQRIVFGPYWDPMKPPRKDDSLRMTDAVIDRNEILRADVGIFVGGSTTGVLVSGNRFEQVETPITCNPDHCLVVP